MTKKPFVWPKTPREMRAADEFWFSVMVVGAIAVGLGAVVWWFQ